MIDALYRQQLRDQVEQARYLLDEIMLRAKLVDLFIEDGDLEKMTEAGLAVSELGIELYELAPDLCDTAARFDLLALANAAVDDEEIPPGFTAETWAAACRHCEKLAEVSQGVEEIKRAEKRLQSVRDFWGVRERALREEFRDTEHWDRVACILANGSPSIEALAEKRRRESEVSDA